MRFKLILAVKSRAYGNVLPVSYQYELSACIYHRLTGNAAAYGEWVGLNGFDSSDHIRQRILSVSNLYIPKIKVEGDRLCILAPKVQLWVSLLPERYTEAYVDSMLQGITFTIGDRISKVEFEVLQIDKCPELPSITTGCYIALSPIVFTDSTGYSARFLSPEDEGYETVVLQSLLSKYAFFYGKEFPYEATCSIELFSTPKRKGIYIKRFTDREVKVIGYMYKFKLTTHPILHKLMYCIGFGEKVNLGFGCVETTNHPEEMVQGVS